MYKFSHTDMLDHCVLGIIFFNLLTTQFQWILGDIKKIKTTKNMWRYEESDSIQIMHVIIPELPS